MSKHRLKTYTPMCMDFERATETTKAWESRLSREGNSSTSLGAVDYEGKKEESLTYLALPLWLVPVCRRNWKSCSQISRSLKSTVSSIAAERKKRNCWRSFAAWHFFVNAVINILICVRRKKKELATCIVRCRSAWRQGGLCVFNSSLFTPALVF